MTSTAAVDVDPVGGGVDGERRPDRAAPATTPRSASTSSSQAIPAPGSSLASSMAASAPVVRAPVSWRTLHGDSTEGEQDVGVNTDHATARLRPGTAEGAW